LLVNEEGLPVAVDLHAGNRHDLKAAGSIIRAVPKRKALTADRGYDSQAFRHKLRQLNIRPLIPKRQCQKRVKHRMPSPVTYRKRWKVERCFAWLDKFKRLTTRYERQSRLYKAFWQLGCVMLLLENLTG
jgi:transposase